MWSDFSGKAYTREQFAQRIAELKWTDWHPRGITLHNTSAPTLAQWAESGPKHDARIANLQSYYEGMGWHGGPHWFISRNWLNEFSNPLRRGTHSRCYNATHFGIEMVGDFAVEPFDSGDGALVRDNAVFAMAVLCKCFGWDPAVAIVFHKDCQLDNHDCPGKLVTKADIMMRVKAEMERPNTVAPAAPPPLPNIPVETTDRLRMARAILDFEARRNSDGHLAVYPLPAGDRGGSYEVAGINETYDKPMAEKLVALLRAGEFDEAESVATEYIASNTDPAAELSSIPMVQFFLRDCVFNRGQTGAIRILQRALHVHDNGIVGPITRAAMTKAEVLPKALLTSLRRAREEYEREVVGYRAQFWNGLVKRWNNALKIADTFSNKAA